MHLQAYTLDSVRSPLFIALHKSDFRAPSEPPFTIHLSQALLYAFVPL